MITITKPTYKCEHCSKLYQLQRFAEAHEPKCYKNPDNFRICHSCPHLKQGEKTYYFDTEHGDGSKKVKVFRCDKLGLLLHPASVEHSEQGAWDFGDELNEPMKKECEHFAESESHVDYFLEVMGKK